MCTGPPLSSPPSISDLRRTSMANMSIKAVAGALAGLCALVLAGIYVPDPTVDASMRGVLAVGGTAALTAAGAWAVAKFGKAKAPEAPK